MSAALAISLLALLAFGIGLWAGGARARRARADRAATALRHRAADAQEIRRDSDDTLVDRLDRAKRRNGL